MVYFGQVVVGPPGSGKTTYCNGMLQFLSALNRKAVCVNMDFANDSLPYTASIDVRELISLEKVMETEKLGPNGGLVFCMEALLANMDWLKRKIEELPDDVNYVIFDFPGQVELYSHHKCVQNLLNSLKELDFRLTGVHLVDSFYCSQPATFISGTHSYMFLISASTCFNSAYNIFCLSLAVLLTASTMMRLGLPHVNVLSKVDMLGNYGQLPFNLDFYTELEDLRPLARFVSSNSSSCFSEQVLDVASENAVLEAERRVEAARAMESPLTRKFKKMTTELCDVLSDFGLISFLPVDIRKICFIK
jgi:GTPase SAR1 family protein